MRSYFILSAFILGAFVIAISNTISYSAKTDITQMVVMPDSAATCPVTGDAITDEHVGFRYIDKDIKFCNDGCIMAYKKDPSKYSEVLKCMPCNDDDGKAKINTTHNGVKYYFCGEGCKGKFEAKPEAYLEKFMK